MKKDEKGKHKKDWFLRLAAFLSMVRSLFALNDSGSFRRLALWIDDLF